MGEGALDHFFELANIYPARARAFEETHFAVLERAQELRLEGAAGLAYRVDDEQAWSKQLDASAQLGAQRLYDQFNLLLAQKKQAECDLNGQCWLVFVTSRIRLAFRYIGDTRRAASRPSRPRASPVILCPCTAAIP